MHFLYSIGSYLAFSLAFPILLLHPKLREGWIRRFGFYPRKAPFFGTSKHCCLSVDLSSSQEIPGSIEVPDLNKEERSSRGTDDYSHNVLLDETTKAGPRIWFHGASAGDLSALSPMIREIRAKLPNSCVFVSCLTNSGALMARQRFSYVDAITFQPWDLPGSTRRAVEAIRPDLLVLEYTEVWPNLIRAARTHGSLIVMTNGRFSPQKLLWYKILFVLAGKPLDSFDLFLMRTEEEAERALELGARADRVEVSGNTKFDALSVGEADDPDALRKAFGLGDRQKVWVAGSTHEGEEQIILDIYSRLLKRHSELRLILAPRYADRAHRLVSVVQRAGFSARLRTGIDNDINRDQIPEVGILDSIGELVTCYRLASMVFVGGSFTNRGGQNILEPAAQGKPVLFGPNMNNFRDSVRLLVGRGGIQVSDKEHLYRVLSELFESPQKIIDLGELARRTVQGVRGASQRNVEMMIELLDGRGLVSGRDDDCSRSGGSK